MSEEEKDLAGSSSKCYHLSDEDQLRGGLAHLYEEKSMCDVELEADGKLFPAHKVVLAAGITYFEAMFTRGFKEAEGKSVKLEGVSSTGLEMLLHALYTGKVEVNDGNFQDVVSASHHLQYQPLLNVCQKYVTDTLDTTNCVDFRRIADVYMTSVVADIDRFILDNFKQFRGTSSFQQLSKVEFCRYLNEDSLIADEAEVFEAIKSWISFDEDRKEHTDEIAKFLRYALLDDDIKDKVSEVLPCLTEEIELTRDCDGSDNSQREVVKPILQRDKLSYRPRGYRTYAMLLRGHCDPYRYSNDGSRDKLAFLREREVDGRNEFVGWHAIAPVAFLDLSVHSFVFNNYWFLLGVDSDGYSYSFLCFDCKKKKWVMLDPPNTPAAIGTYGFLLDDKLCIGGGAFINENLDSKSEKPAVLDSACLYDIAQDEWREINDQVMEFSTDLAQIESRQNENKIANPDIVYAAFCDFKGEGYIIGGYKSRLDEQSDEEVDSPWDEYVICKSVTVFKPDINGFVAKASLNSARCHATAGVVSDKILVVGGLPSESRRPEKACEIYSPRSDQWTYVVGDQTIGDALFVPTPSGFAVQKDENYPLSYFEADKDGNVKAYDRVYMPGVRWNPGRDHWRDIGCKIVTVAMMTMLPAPPGTWQYKTKDTVFGLVSKAKGKSRNSLF